MCEEPVLNLVVLSACGCAFGIPPHCINCLVLINKIKHKKLVFVPLFASSVAISIIYTRTELE